MKFVQYRRDMYADRLQRQATYIYNNFQQITQNLPGILKVWADPLPDGSIFIQKVNVGKHFGPGPDLNKVVISLLVKVITTEELVVVCKDHTMVELPKDCIGAIRFFGTVPKSSQCLADVIICITPDMRDVIVHDLLSSRQNQSSVLSIQDIYLFINYLYNE